MEHQKEFRLGCLALSVLFGGVILSFWVGSSGWGFNDNALLSSPVFWEIRLPRTIQAVVCGGGLALAGWLMQALFRNPLASPSILGVTNGASLGVAWATMIMVSMGSIASIASQVLAGATGAFVVLLLLAVLKRWIQSVTGLLIFGVMMGHFAGALETIFQQWTERENLSGLIYWSMGSFERANLMSILLMLSLLACGVIFVKVRSRTLDAWILGDDFARSVGISISHFSTWLIFVSGVLTALITTFCGPIAFIGLASPHLTKLWLKRRNHGALLWGVLLTGAIISLYCDILTRVLHLPLNAITSLVGAPWVMWWIIKKGKNAF